MPIRGTVDPPPNEPLYFRSLEEFDKYTPTRNSYFDGIPKFKPSRNDPETVHQGKLLVCHDYKLGYIENSFARSYTFNFWSLSDIFVYFSHNRITIPPPGWISAAHRQGVKILGTIIVEPSGTGQEDCQLLVNGKIPASKLAQTDLGTVSPYYARLLAELARERGFDGYLINIEVSLTGSYAQARALAAWITILQSELVDKVGPYAETHWYDSVVLNGHVRYQNRVNFLNLPFFLSSTAFFSNYWWRNDEPFKTIEYFFNLPTPLTEAVPDSHPQLSPKTLQQIYIGVDAWGRHCHGGHGFGLYRSIDHILPSESGLSVALFGPGWTWEKLEEFNGPNFTWEKWWEWETSLWVGPATGKLGAEIKVPDLEMKSRETPCQHGPFQPIASYFAKKTPPDPADVPFYTHFCPGTGTKWFVEGEEVFDSKTGWTDVDKQTSLGDMLWPRPMLFREDGSQDGIPSTSITFNLSDAWNGGSSLIVGIRSAAVDQTAATYWIPIQSLTITPRKGYQASLVYKVTSITPEGPHFSLSLRRFADSKEHSLVDITSGPPEDVGDAWKKLDIDFKVNNVTNDNTAEHKVCIGLVIKSSTPINTSISLGQLNVSGSLPPSSMDYKTLIPWVDYHQQPTAQPTTTTASPFSGTLTWDVSTQFPAIAFIDMEQPENPNPPWKTQPTTTGAAPWFPSFLYFNVYAQPFFRVEDVPSLLAREEQSVQDVDSDRRRRPRVCQWIGTSKSGWSGRQHAFAVMQENLPSFSMPVSKIRFYVQWVSDLGEVLKLDECPFVDVSGSFDIVKWRT